MKRKILFRAILLFLCAFNFVSCNDEDETFHPLNFNSKGIDWVENPSNPFILTSRISADGAVFSLQGSDKYSDMAYVSEAIVDDVIYKPVENDLFNDTSSYQEEWGEIINSSATRPFTMTFKIAPNKSEKERIFKITIGYGYWYRNLEIIQSSAIS